MTSTEMTIEILKEMALKVYENVSHLIGTAEGARKIEKGAGGDISMHIDIVAENTIVNIIERDELNVLLLSEEIGKKYFGNKQIVENTKAKIIVDPIDGSTNSSRDIPFYSVSIAYAEGEKIDNIKMAVILDLTNKDIYWAIKNKGAYFNDKKIHISNRQLGDQLIFEVDFNLWNLRRKLKKYSSILRKIYRIRVMGSIALSFCLLAKGSIDGYIDFRRGTRLVDIAASYLILKEAGGKIYSIKGEDLDFELSMDIHLPLVASNSNLESFLKSELIKI
ncbi:MAG: hypothetical protein GF311_16975 [Candidatus Lokiarchaeota archaeon]|nr:hypothetical protein [Candidatus Lokiarchaeota archaeon]